MELYSDLSTTDLQELYKYPVYITLLAANLDAQLDDKEKEVAAELLHIKTYKETDSRLKEFYENAQVDFVKNLEQLDAALPEDKDQREEALRHLLEKTEAILHRMGPELAQKFRGSMIAFKDHVSRAHENVFEHFVFPLPIKGFSDI